MRTASWFFGCLIALGSTHMGLAQQDRPAAERLGTVHFETSCSPSVRQEFDHRFGQHHLHNRLAHPGHRAPAKRIFGVEATADLG